MDRDEILKTIPTPSLMSMRDMCATMLDIVIDLPPDVTPIQFFNRQLKVLEQELASRLLKDMGDIIDADSEDITLTPDEQKALDELEASFKDEAA